MDDKSLRAYMAELIGTLALVFVSAGAVHVSYVTYVDRLQPSATTVRVSVALASGLIYAAALAITLPLAGGYLNPAVIITLWVFKRLDGLKTAGFLAVQVLGAALAGLLLWALLGFREDLTRASHLGTPQFNTDFFGHGQAGSTILPYLKGIAVEFVMTFLVVFAVFGTLLDPRAKLWAGSWAGRLACLWIGLVLVAVTLVGYPLTGAAVNPVRWLGPAIWDRIYEIDAFAFNAVYWVGPIAGGLVAGWVYTALVLPPEEEQRKVVQKPPMSGSIAAGAGSGLSRAKR